MVTTETKRVRRKRGTGPHKPLTLRLPDDLVDRIDTWALGYGDMSRSVAIRCLVALSLDRPRPKTVVDPGAPESE